ncbi:lariat debranching enzyme, C-terminal domain-containing protein [Durotheca rogersii]|uniref:lariat debranching enzyme, C-terminal domain-containing protein n=1 Tax=Durotheca rogersii TaxID=419775 RepID=UPI00221FE14F|nr:lariat debranching enzyme, C-terminal domain-containing protein [Durotheca rogersii]KAI5863580.1 lariat debranching enzyme, C-terminal domain-containing protein [Durotheca rogersii]
MDEIDGVRIAVEGCGHGTLDAIYSSTRIACEKRGWPNVDLLIIAGDFQAARNAGDLLAMSVPSKYRRLGDFQAYYRGDKTAPYLTIFIGGNHEASSHLLELFYGGWVAPNMYYLGAANILRFGPLRIAGLSGTYNEPDYNLTHHERLPFLGRDVKSVYHVREIDVRKLLLVREQIDIGLSHDWPQGIEYLGDTEWLWQVKPHLKKESERGELGNPAATNIMDRLRPAYWFSGHMHCKFSAIKSYPSAWSGNPKSATAKAEQQTGVSAAAAATTEASSGVGANPDEIDLDMGDDEGINDEAPPAEATGDASSGPSTSAAVADGVVPDELRAQLPASFAPSAPAKPALKPGQPVPPSITNKKTRFLALNKCLPGREFLQLVDAVPVKRNHLRTYPPLKPQPGVKGKAQQRYRLEYDPEWLAITRVFAPLVSIGIRDAVPPEDLGEAAYRPMIDRERDWVEEHIVRAGKLHIPNNFARTAPPQKKGDKQSSTQNKLREFRNPQTTLFCKRLGIPDLWDTPESEGAEPQNTPAEDLPAPNSPET